jgi:hypothetical protein
MEAILKAPLRAENDGEKAAKWAENADGARVGPIDLPASRVSGPGFEQQGEFVTAFQATSRCERLSAPCCRPARVGQPADVRSLATTFFRAVHDKRLEKILTNNTTGHSIATMRLGESSAWHN